MTLIAAGISYRTASVAGRERLALSSIELPAALASLRAEFGCGAILSTWTRAVLRSSTT